MKYLMSLVMVLSINFLLFISQVSIEKTAESEGFGQFTDYYNYEDGLLSEYDTGNYTVKSTFTDELPETEGSVSTETGNFFTDLFGTVKNWFLDTTGIKQASAVVNAFPNALKNIGTPEEIAFSLGALWHILTLFLIVMVIRGDF